jgi:hypothetical protein
MDYCCRQPSVSQVRLEEQIECFLRQLSIPPRVHEWVTNVVSLNRQDEELAIEQRKQGLRDGLERARRSLENLTSLRIRDLIGDDEFLRERRKLQMEHLRFRQQLDEAGDAVLPFEQTDTLISFRNRAVEWFRAGDIDTKRHIFRIAGSNPTLKDKMLSVQAKRPFLVGNQIGSSSQLLAVRDEVRTLWINRDPELLEIMENIRKLETKFGIQPKDDRRLAA